MVAELEPETIIITSPHATMYADYFHVSPGNAATGSFDRFGAGNVKFLEAYDMELVSQIESIARKQDFPAGTLGEVDRELDHGTMVPLWFIRRKYKGGNIVRIGLSALPLTDHIQVPQVHIRKVHIPEACVTDLRLRSLQLCGQAYQQPSG